VSGKQDFIFAAGVVLIIMAQWNNFFGPLYQAAVNGTPIQAGQKLTDIIILVVGMFIVLIIMVGIADINDDTANLMMIFMIGLLILVSLNRLNILDKIFAAFTAANSVTQSAKTNIANQPASGGNSGRM
jgi:ABC-type transport system involved in cytochrome bd biosynthesis fused ATPase/permease subunit